jgi:hypothetical protein
MTRILSIAAVFAAMALLSPGFAEEGAADAEGETPSPPAPAPEGKAAPAVPAAPEVAPVRRIEGPRLPDTRRLQGERGGEATEGGGAPRPAQASTARDRTRVAACGESPAPAGAHTFQPGESLVFDVDIMGVRAGSLNLSVTPSQGGGLAFTAAARTNNFFANVREVDGRATSFTRDGTLHPARYREDATEDGVRKWAEVVFPAGRHEVDVRFGVGERERRVRYPVTDTPHDLISVVYYLRTLDLSIGQSFCLDVYGNRRMWRISGKVEDEEFVNTPAGGFETWRLSGSAQRMDLPSFERELHVWIAQDERRTPVAAMSSIDLGPVRARLSRLGGAGGQERRPDYGGGRW